MLRMHSGLFIAVTASALFFTADGSSSRVHAQGYSDGPWWNDGRPLRRSRPWFEDYYGRDESWTQRRRARRWRDDDEYWSEYDDEDDWRQDRTRRKTRRAAPEPPSTEDDEFEGPPRKNASDKPVGVDGGPRPSIAPKSPPIVAFASAYAPGSIVIDTNSRKLYFVIRTMAAFAYPIGVGRDGFSWTGEQKVSRIADWPDWYPPAEMRKRKPELPKRMLGGLNNPLGAKAIYLGNTLYRIHGTNDPKSIGRAESSGCFRMLNAHVLHLASLVKVGTPVTVMKSVRGGPEVAGNSPPRPRLSQQAPPPRVQRRPRQDRWWEDDFNDDYR